MRRNASRHAMHRAVRSLCTSRSLEAVFEVLNGVHPLDSFDTARHPRDERRNDVREMNARAGRRVAFVCDREDRARTKSTAQLRDEVHEAAELVRSHAAEIVSGRRQTARWLNRALAVYRAARARLAARLAESAVARRARVETNAADALEPADFAPTTGAGPEPLGIAHPPGALTRRENLTDRPTVERLTRTLAIAPGAPSLAVCV